MFADISTAPCGNNTHRGIQRMVARDIALWSLPALTLLACWLREPCSMLSHKPALPEPDADPSRPRAEATGNGCRSSITHEGWL